MIAFFAFMAHQSSEKTGDRKVTLEQLQTERRLRLQYALTRVLAESESLAEAVPKFLQAFCIVGAWDFAEMWRIDSATNVMRFEGQWHDPKLNAEEFIAASRKLTLSQGEGMAGRVWMLGKPIWTTDPEILSQARRTTAGQLGFRTWLAFPIRDQHQTVGVITSFSRDIRQSENNTLEMLEVLGTQIGDFIRRKRAEEAIVHSEKRFRALIENSYDAITMMTSEGIIVYMTPSVKRILGYSYEEFLGKNVFDFIHPQERGDARQLLARLLQLPGGTATAEYRIRRKDGSWRWIEASTTNLLDDPAVKAIVSNNRDITDRKNAEEVIQRKTAQLERQAELLELANVMIRDPQGRIIFWNKGSEELYGWTKEEAISKVSHELLQTFFPKPLEELERELLLEGHWQGEVVHTKKEGSQIHVACHWVLHRNDQDQPVAILEVGNDITELKHAWEEIRKLNEELELRVRQRTAQLEAANKELETFSYSVSHDLRAPLRAVDGFSRELLTRAASQLDAESRHYLSVIRMKTKKMGELIDDLLMFSRVTRMEFDKSEIDMNGVVHSVIEDLLKLHPEQKFDITTDPLEPIKGSTPMIRQVWMNLLSNAMKFTGKTVHPRIEVRCSPGPEEVTYCVRDNGVGFDMRHADKLFGVFQRVHKEDEFPGTGVGLAIVERIVHRHGGRVRVEAKVNEGAAFYFTLPKEVDLS